MLQKKAFLKRSQQQKRKRKVKRKVAKKAVEAPKGFHWMKAGKGFKLMKNPAGGYKPHKGASQKATFEIQKVHSGKIK